MAIQKHRLEFGLWGLVLGFPSQTRKLIGYFFFLALVLFCYGNWKLASGGSSLEHEVPGRHGALAFTPFSAWTGVLVELADYCLFSLFGFKGSVFDFLIQNK